MAFSVGFGLYVNYEAQGLQVTFFDTMMAMIPHYCFWVLVSPPLYRALHLTIQGPRRALWLPRNAGHASQAGQAEHDTLSVVHLPAEGQRLREAPSCPCSIALTLGNVPQDD